MRTDAAPPFSAYAVFLVVAAAMILVGGLLQLLLPLALGLMLSEVLCILAPALVLQRMYSGTWPRRLIPAMPEKPLGWATLGALLVATVFVGLLANIGAALVVHFVPTLQERQAEYMVIMQQLLNPPEWWKALAGILAITVFAPVCEEILFRGTILKVQLRDNKPAVAIVVNGLMFGVIHFNEMSLVSLSVVGAFFAWLTYRTGSVMPAIFSHAALNGVNGVVLPRIVGFEALKTPGLDELLVAAGVLGALGGAGVWVLSRLLPQHEPGTESR